MFNNKTLKIQLSLRISTIIVFIWACVISVYFWDRHRLNDIDFKKEASRQKKNIDYIIGNKNYELSTLARIIVDKINNSRTSEKKSIRSLERNLKKIWEETKEKNTDTQLIYYNKFYQPIIALNLLIISEDSLNNKYLSIKNLENHGNFENFISCTTICYLNVIKMIQPYSSSDDENYINLRLPLGNIIWEVQESSNTEVAILEQEKRYEFSDKIVINKNHYFINNSTESETFKKISKHPINIKGSTYNTIQLNDNNHLLITLLKIGKNINLLMSKDITHEIQQRNDDLIKIITISLFITLATIVLIVYALRAPIQILQLINDTLPLIGQGKYQQVTKILAAIPLQSSSREITEMKHSLSAATYQVEALHSGLTQSIEEITDQLSFTQELINSSRAIFVIYNEQHHIQLCNSYAAEAIGITQKQLLKRNFFSEFNLDPSISCLYEGENPAYNQQFQSTLQRNNHNKLISWSQNRYFSQSDQQNLYICVGVDITERLALEERISYLANHDDLTGLINRRRLNQILEKLIEKHNPFYFLYIDLNYFKVINDTLGHTAGDKLLISFAQIMQNVFADKGIAARTGGDEFTAILFQGETEAIETCNELIKKCKHINVFGKQEQFLSAKVGLSIGVVSYPQHAKNEAELHAHADAAMYENKIERASSYHIYTGKERLIRKNYNIKYWTDLLEESLDCLEIMPYFQSIHTTDRHFNPKFYEALCRVKKNGKMIRANTFIDHIVNKPTIAKVDMHILRETMRIIAKLPSKQTVMVNISAYTLSLPHIDKTITDLARTENISPQYIVFEITEQTVMKDIDKTIAVLHRMREKGFRFALDDFGTGYSSLSYLQRLPVQFLKMDKSFINSNTETNETSLNFMQNIVKLVQSLGIVVIIEGVEDAKQARLARKIGANYQQGYFLSKPQADISSEMFQQNFKVIS